MPKDDLVYVGHILDVARRAHEKVATIDRAEFDADENLRLAVTHLIQVIGEAASRISKGYCARPPQFHGRQLLECATRSFTIT